MDEGVGAHIDITMIRPKQETWDSSCPGPNCAVGIGKAVWMQRTPGGAQFDFMFEQYKNIAIRLIFIIELASHVRVRDPTTLLHKSAHGPRDVC